ncbi:MAG: TetR/AcrR family transcriptional regulator [Sporichthyaceae bacterium]
MTSAPQQITRTQRQRELLSAAADLFARHGYHAVGINDISGALGLTGPAFYRHYPSKEAVLVAILEDAVISHLEDVAELGRTIGDPLAALTAIVDNHVAFVFDHTSDIMTWRTEVRSLPEADRHRLRYLMRLYTEEWVRAVAALRPDVELESVRAMCHGAIALIQSATEFTSRLPRATAAPLLAAMAVHVLVTSPVPAPVG